MCWPGAWVDASFSATRMKSILILPILLVSLSQATAVDRLDRPEALRIACLVAANLKQLQATPIPTDVDLKYVQALHEGEYGAMILPEAKLTADSIAKAGAEPASLGQLWLRKLSPVVDGEGVAADKLRLAKVQTGEEEETAVQLTLAVRRKGDAAPELLIYGKDKTPLLTVPLKPLDAAAVRLDERLHNRQAQARAAELARTRLVHAIEPLEQARQMFRPNPRAAIDDVHLHVAALRGNAHEHLLIRRRMAHRVLHEVRQHRFERDGIARHNCRSSGFAAEGDLVRCRQRRELGAHVRGEDARINRLAFYERLACVGVREGQQVLDDAAEADDFLAVAGKHRAIPLRRTLLAQCHLDFPAQDGERCAQLVRRVGHEALLDEMGFAQPGSTSRTRKTTIDAASSVATSVAKRLSRKTLIAGCRDVGAARLA